MKEFEFNDDDKTLALIRWQWNIKDTNDYDVQCMKTFIFKTDYIEDEIYAIKWNGDNKIWYQYNVSWPATTNLTVNMEPVVSRRHRFQLTQ